MTRSASQSSGVASVLDLSQIPDCQRTDHHLLDLLPVRHKTHTDRHQHQLKNHTDHPKLNRFRFHQARLVLQVPPALLILMVHLLRLEALMERLLKLKQLTHMVHPLLPLILMELPKAMI